MWDISLYDFCVRGMLHIKILLAGLHQEVNTFGPGKTTLADYKRKQYLLGEDMFTFAKNHVRCNEGADGIAGCYGVLTEAGAEICGRMAILAEGDAQNRGDLIYLEKLPLFDGNGGVL